MRARFSVMLPGQEGNPLTCQLVRRGGSRSDANSPGFVNLVPSHRGSENPVIDQEPTRNLLPSPRNTPVIPTGVEGSAVAFSWFRAEHVPCLTALKIHALHQPQLTSKVSSRPEWRDLRLHFHGFGWNTAPCLTAHENSCSPTNLNSPQKCHPDRSGGIRGCIFVVSGRTRSMSDCPENSCSAPTSTHLKSVIPTGVEGSAVAFSWFRAEHVPCLTALKIHALHQPQLTSKVSSRPEWRDLRLHFHGFGWTTAPCLTAMKVHALPPTSTHLKSVIPTGVEGSAVASQFTGAVTPPDEP